MADDGRITSFVEQALMAAVNRAKALRRTCRDLFVCIIRGVHN